MNDSLNLKAIAFFSATGFFPGDETYYNNLKYEYPKSSSFAETYNKSVEERVWTREERFQASIEVAHFGPFPF